MWIVSDLHLTGDIDRYPVRFPIPWADICVMAGDLSEDIEASMRWLGRYIRPMMPVIYVLGNHDFLGSSLVEAPAAARQFADANGVFLLDNSAVNVGRTRFIGSTLWTDFQINADNNLKTERDVLVAWHRGKLPTSRAMALTGKTIAGLNKRLSELGFSARSAQQPPSETDYLRNCRSRAFANLRRAMPEYANVSVDMTNSGRMPRLMKPADAYKLHVSSIDRIESELTRPFDGPTVVVTHHAPHPGSISEEFECHPLNPAFTSDLSRIIDRYAPDLWIHGHTHSSFDYFVGRTRIICNPHGGEYQNPRFEWQKVIEV